jgi:hypothetical protein
VTGKVDPETENPVPLTEAEFTVTAVLPIEVRVTVWVDSEFRDTLPNATFVALTLRDATAGVNCRAKVLDTPPELAVRVTVCALVNELTVAVKGAVVALAATVAELGTVTVLLLLEMVTFAPPDGAGPLRVGVHVTLPAPVTVELLQENALSVGAGGFNWIP